MVRGLFHCCCVVLLSGVVLSAVEDRLALAGENAGEIRAFLDSARERHGEFGGKAAAFLVEGMPAADLRELTSDFLLENLDLAMKARKEFPWAAEVPDEIFFNDVLPYASLDETRERWRKEFYPECARLVKDCTTAAEAAQALNKGFFNIIGVHYDTGRKAPNQSPSESKKIGKASCTGLSIILVNACRAVGIPARVAGIARWPDKSGNHTWVEIHDGGGWFFTGADEYNANGLNRAWFAGDASKAVADDWRHAIWATSWMKTGERFPMVWNLASREVPGVNVTARYAGTGPEESGTATVHLRLWDQEGGKRLAAPVELIDATGKVLGTVTTRAGTADLNDMPALEVEPGTGYRLRVEHADQVRWKDLRAAKRGALTIDLVWSRLEKPRVGNGP